MNNTKFLAVFILFASFSLKSQNKQDYYWPFGANQEIWPEFGAIEIDFNQKPFEAQIRSAGLEFDQNNASICDKNGNLLFYSNGCAVANRLHQVMPNGDSINAGLFFDRSWLGDCGGGYPGRQNITILPDPSYEDGYYLITLPTTTDSITFESFIDKMQYSYVDMSLENGLGDVVEKNVVFHDGLTYSAYLTSIAHSNKKDYWIINPLLPTGYIIYLLDNNGIKFSSVENGPVWDDFYSNDAGDARFSPDGAKYAIFNRWEGIRIYNFDRQLGSLSNEQVIPWRPAEQGRATSCEWSPNSRFLYVMQFDSLFQLDTWAEPSEDGLEFIDEWNGAVDPVRMFFHKSALGPDCRIYIRPNSSSRSFHVINRPDEKGTACDFIQQGIRLPYATSSGSFPNHPRFRVDEEEKCDPSITSLFGEDIFWRRDLTTYPNPVSDILYVVLPDNKKGDIYIMDMSGKIIKQNRNVTDRTYEININDMTSGIYNLEFVPEHNNEQVIYTSKVVIVK